MANNIYGYDQTPTNVEVLTSKEMVLTIEGMNKFTGTYLVQNVNIRYPRGVRTIREMGSPIGYQIKMPPMGQFVCDTVIGKSSICKELKKVASTPGGVSITLAGKNGKRNLSGCKVQSYAIGVSVGQNIITENFTFTFADMSIV